MCIIDLRIDQIEVYSMSGDLKSPGVPNSNVGSTVIDIQSRLKARLAPKEVVEAPKPTRTDIMNEDTRRGFADAFNKIVQFTQQQKKKKSNTRQKLIEKYQTMAKPLAKLKGIHLNTEAWILVYHSAPAMFRVEKRAPNRNAASTAEAKCEKRNCLNLRQARAKRRSCLNFKHR